MDKSLLFGCTMAASRDYPARHRSSQCLARGRESMRLLCVMMLSPLLLTIAVAQQPASDDQTMTTSCTFTDGNQVTLEYNISHKEEPQNGKVWMPGGAAMVLFAQTPLVLNNVQIPVGGYTMYVVPGKKTWSVIVSRTHLGVAANDDAPGLLARNDVHGVAADRDLDVVENERGLGEKNHGGATRHPDFAVLGFFFVRNVVFQRHLVAVRKSAGRSHRLIVRSRLLSNRDGKQQRTEHHDAEQTHGFPPPR